MAGPYDFMLESDTDPGAIIQNSGGSTTSVSTKDNTGAIGAGGAAGLGLIQMAIGLNQAKKARRLPFPSYRGAQRPLLETRQLYRNMYETGLGSERESIMRAELASQRAGATRRISESSPQASAYMRGMSGLSGVKGEQMITQSDIQAKQMGLTGIERMNAALTSIEQAQIEADRQYKLLAQKAAGEAIKAGTENIARGALIFGGAEQVA